MENPMTDRRERTTAAIQKLVACYPRFGLTKANLDAYTNHLEPYDPDLLETVLNHMPERFTFFPSIAEIIQAVDPSAIPPPPAKRTGYRLVRGSHGSTYIRDDEGTDELPHWMQG